MDEEEKKKSKEKVVVRELDSKIKEIKKEEVVEEPEEEEDFDEFVENLWDERMHEETKEKEDAWNPKGLILEANNPSSNTLENSLREVPFASPKFTEDSSRREGPLYGPNASQEEGNLYTQNKEGQGLYTSSSPNGEGYDAGRPSEESGSSLYDGNISTRAEGIRDTSSDLEGFGPENREQREKKDRHYMP